MNAFIPPTNVHAEQSLLNGYRPEGGNVWEVCHDDGSGQPLRFPRCTWCGSMTPQLFIELLQTPNTSCEVADMKYGYPHKIYVTTPNPNPDELRECSSTSVGSEPRYNERGAVTHRVKTQDHAPEGFPDWSDRRGWHQKSTYPTLHLKFYTAHLMDLPELEQHAELIAQRTGIRFWRDTEGRLMCRSAKGGAQ
jgi:hypothetical protein